LKLVPITVECHAGFKADDSGLLLLYIITLSLPAAKQGKLVRIVRRNLQRRDEQVPRIGRVRIGGNGGHPEAIPTTLGRASVDLNVVPEDDPEAVLHQ
jgi:hypothetical protein